MNTTRRSMTASSAIVLAAVVAGSAGCASEDGAASRTEPAAASATEERAPLPSPTSTGAEGYPEGSAFRVLLEDGRFTTFVGILEELQPGRTDLLEDPEHTATLLVPTDAAFRRSDPQLLEQLLDEQALGRFLSNHVINDPMDASEIAAVAPGDVPTLGVPLAVEADDQVVVAGVPISDADIAAGWTVIHAVDELILPCNDAYLVDVLGDAYRNRCTG